MYKYHMYETVDLLKMVFIDLIRAILIRSYARAGFVKRKSRMIVYCVISYT